MKIKHLLPLLLLLIIIASCKKSNLPESDISGNKKTSEKAIFSYVPLTKNAVSKSLEIDTTSFFVTVGPLVSNLAPYAYVRLEAEGGITIAEREFGGTQITYTFTMLAVGTKFRVAATASNGSVYYTPYTIAGVENAGVIITVPW